MEFSQSNLTSVLLWCHTASSFGFSLKGGKERTTKKKAVYVRLPSFTLFWIYCLVIISWHVLMAIYGNKTYKNRDSMISSYSLLPVNSLLLGIFEGLTSTTSSPSLVLAPKQQIKAILRLYLNESNSNVRILPWMCTEYFTVSFSLIIW